MPKMVSFCLECPKAQLTRPSLRTLLSSFSSTVRISRAEVIRAPISLEPHKGEASHLNLNDRRVWCQDEIHNLNSPPRSTGLAEIRSWWCKHGDIRMMEGWWKETRRRLLVLWERYKSLLYSILSWRRPAENKFIKTKINHYIRNSTSTRNSRWK
jgi:hypothetical protein